MSKITLFSRLNKCLRLVLPAMVALTLSACVAEVSPQPAGGLGPWVPGHYNRFHAWVPGHYVGGPASGPVNRGAWVPGHYNRFNQWVPGHWR